MICRFTLAAVMATLTLAGCASQHKSEPSAPTESADTRFFKGPAQISANDFSEGPTEVKVSHVISRTDDGSPIYVTVDGNDAGAIIRGQSLELHLPAGDHQIGGYVPTLLGFGRVTVQSIKITTRPDQVKQVAYSVTRSKPAFTEKAAIPVTTAKAAPAPENIKTATAAVSTPATTTSAAPVSTPASSSEAATATQTTSAPVTAPAAATVPSAPATTSTTESGTSAETQSAPATTSGTEATASKTTSTSETAAGSESASTEKTTSAEAASTQG
ncbi:hypothetical protein [Pantoea sp. CCBC3-3-1]|uniref:hypothetical protein n=1 Tax=Pantoea sp. CCBC3-3-1 TaxID=2490851 RepID=UPI0015803F3F|nr:hypothetical protein [Pantoea sp. CCBC3-3-1]